ncbi:MAG: hypothetical protein KME21_27300 [Desmonostoc vinosum HA7617-LM4]|jgi:chromosomal replication initiation ATPase DnaA|nr:hypothetical protein [Desmonostoc vinosum HA7617-LM4]
MFGFIKKLITGILGFITGLLPKKKDNGYFLELVDEVKDAKPIEAAKEAASNVKKATETVTASAKKATETITETLTSDAPTPSKPASLNGTKTTAKSKAKTTKEPKPADIQLVQTAEGLKVEPGNNAKAKAAKAVQEQPKETTFAPKYLAPSAGSSNGRRRPGANMSSFLDMARQVKTPG